MARAGYGIVVLAWPDRVAGGLLRRGLGPRERVVARVLASRQLVQALGSGARPGYPVLALGAQVDLAHAVSMLGLGLLNRRHRRAALSDAVIAAGFALAGRLAARSTGGCSSSGSS
ncbi:MAG: hypothetical protein L0H79_04880 [Intrasporangium sp.]|uniref:hypothetical protein n=1 Tax=Intrasporangium sp. TaxID=1925024 RepID=UPI002647E1EC|nr:hypothetical protein [Intrasporangium sp.]MDN5795069.1 hypothetical protein [Intrasporangium sp.]